MLNSLLDAISVLQSVGSVLLAVLILLVMITVHEFGHYIVGKILKFKINEFSIGFGPAIFKYTHKKSGELFSIRLIPLGGYCAFEAEDGLAEEAGRAEKKEGMPEEIVRDDVFTELSPSPVVPAEKRPKERGRPRIDWAEREKSGKFCDQRPWKRILVLIAGATMNYLLALLCIIVSFTACGQLSLMTYEVEPSESVASEYCFRNKDVLLKVEGKNIYGTSDLMSALRDKREGEEVKFFVSRVTETDAEGKTVAREEMDVVVKLRSATNFENSADTDRLWQALGVAKERGEDGGVVTDEEGNPYYQIYSTSYRLGFFTAIGRSFVYSFKIAGSIFKVLGELLTGSLGIDTMGGPVTTIRVTSQIAARGLQSFLEITAYIGVNLAVFNLLPIPALDGSKVIFTAIEWARGKPVNRKVEAMIHTIGILFLFGFAILVDILQLL